MPYVPIYNAASDIIAAFEAGRASRRQKEQDQLKKDQDARDYQEKVRQFNEQLKMDEQRYKAEEAYRKSQQAHQQSLENYQRTNARLNIQQAIAQGLIKPNIKKELAPGQNWAMNNPQLVDTPTDFTMNDITIPASEIVLPEEYNKNLREQDLAKGASEIEAVKAREALNLASEARRNEEWDRRDDKNFQQQKQMFDLTSARMLGMMNLRDREKVSPEDGSPTDLALLRSGGITYDSFTGKDKNRYYNIATKNNIFPQTKKFVEDSKKLTSTAQFYSMVDRIANNNIKDVNEFAQLLADGASLVQQVGTLGAQYPALGRLSDPDIRLLQTGQPSVKLAILSKFFGKLPDQLRKNLLRNMKNSYASQVLSHLSTVPAEMGSPLTVEELENPQIKAKYPTGIKKERQRLMEHYGWYIPGLENTDVFRGIRGGK